MKAHVLIVDDSLTVRMDLAEAFDEAGFTTAVCGSVAEALAAIAERLPALAILDVVLPDGDGVALLSELRAREDTAALPIILLSTEAEVADRIRGLTHGASEYIGKPYDGAYVVARAAALVHAHDGVRTRPRALVVDDSVTYREALGEVLRSEGYDTTLTASGEEGLRRAAELHPDVVVVDGVMPGMGGATVVRRLRLDPGLSATPCLMLTAAEGRAAEMAALDAGADAYVCKSDGPAMVLARLKAMLRAAPETRERGSDASLLGPKRILAVDDSVTYLEGLAEVLRDEGYEVIKAPSGEAALELLAVERVDCILLDLLMPGLSGTETCRRVKGAKELRNVPLIMLTALGEPEAMIEGINAGADDYVSKAADFEVLRARIRAQLRRKQFEDESRRVREAMLRQEAETRAAQELAATKSALLARVAQKNTELEALTRELRMFAYSVSHDLRQPLRSIDGFGAALLRQYADQLDDTGRHYLERIRAGAQRMGELIDGMLALSRVTRQPLRRQTFELGAVAVAVFERLREADPARRVTLSATPGLVVCADRQLVESALENLLGNAWKFTAARDPAHIEVGTAIADGAVQYLVRDDGVGFYMEHADRLFAPFHRLHRDAEYAGTGIGLATVQRIIHRHGGTIRAESAPGQGATFYFTLGAQAADDEQT